MTFLLKPLKFFFYTAFKPWESRFEALEEIMKMQKIMSTDTLGWDKSNDEIPTWFYQMIASMGVSVCLGFLLILAGSL